MSPMIVDKFVSTSRFVHAAVLMSALVISPLTAMARGNACALIFDSTVMPIKIANLDRQAAAGYASWNLETYATLQLLKARMPGLSRSSQGLLKPMLSVIKDEQLSHFHASLGNALDAIEADFVSGRVLKQPDGTYSIGGKLAGLSEAAVFRQLLKDHLLTELARVMSSQEAEKRVAMLDAKTLTKSDLLLALGRLSAQETLAQLIGPHGIDNVTADSIVGRYLSRAAKLGVSPATMVGSFRIGPESATKGPKRLYIAVDRTTAALANELFADDANLLLHDHGNKQGTMELRHDGEAVTYGRYKGRSTLDYADFKAVPLIVLSSIESANATNFFELGRLSGKARAKYPWSLRDSTVPGDEGNYCVRGGYNSCTHWIGEMAIGETLVNEYKFPGFHGDDIYGDANDSRVQSLPDQSRIRASSVGRYDQFVKDRAVEPIGEESRLDRLTRIVWRENQGREQLWSMLGTQNELADGKFANPGWAFYTLVGKAKADRVPVVLIYQADASQPITQKTLDDYRAHVNAQ